MNEFLIGIVIVQCITAAILGVLLAKTNKVLKDNIKIKQFLIVWIGEVKANNNLPKRKTKK